MQDRRLMLMQLTALILGLVLLGHSQQVGAQSLPGTRPGTVAPPPAQPTAKLPQPTAKLPQPANGAMLACVIQPGRTADVGTPAAGIVQSIEVERGDVVRKGQVLARMRAEVEQASMGVARSRADSGAEVRGALAAEDLARQKVERSRSLLAQNFISAQALEQAESEFRVARERVALARDQQQISAREASGASAQLSQRVLRAPFDGVITERFANPGERFEDKPLLRLANVSRLRVDVVAPTHLFGRLHQGQSLSIHPELPGAPGRQARVVQIDQVLDPASNTFRVRLDMDNVEDALPAGLRCRAEIVATGAALAAPSAGL